jgi:GTP-binding protein YchF
VKNGARNNKDLALELAVCEKLAIPLRAGKPAREADLLPEERPVAKGFQLITTKPMVYAANVAETDLASFTPEKAREQQGLPASAEVVCISAKIEEELVDLPPEDAAAFLADLGVTSSGLDRLIKAAYRALGYITYFTAGKKEVRAWNVLLGSTAPQAAGVIHTDFEKGFIRAETIAYDDFVKHGGEQGAKEAGKLRSEGKTYVVKDGDMFEFLFNV